MNNSTAKHTSGPWRVETWTYGRRGPVPTIRSDSAAVAEALIPGDLTKTPEADLNAIRDANARLIAAAPELLEALKATLRALDTHLDEYSRRHNIKRAAICPCDTTEVAQARAAIAKAEGRA